MGEPPLFADVLLFAAWVLPLTCVDPPAVVPPVVEAPGAVVVAPGAVVVVAPDVFTSETQPPTRVSPSTSTPYWMNLCFPGSVSPGITSVTERLAGTTPSNSFTGVENITIWIGLPAANLLSIEYDPLPPGGNGPKFEQETRSGFSAMKSSTGSGTPLSSSSLVPEVVPAVDPAVVHEEVPEVVQEVL